MTQFFSLIWEGAVAKKRSAVSLPAFRKCEARVRLFEKYNGMTDIKPDLLALAQCESEPIHTPGAIQPFGALFAFDQASGRIRYFSDNLPEMLGVDLPRVLGRNLVDLLPGDLVHGIRNRLSLRTSQRQRQRAGAATFAGREIEFYCHINPDGLAVVEAEPLLREVHDPDRTDPVEQVRAILSELAARPKIDDMLRYAVAGLQQMTGYDRMKAYVYEPDGEGEVVAEVRSGDVESFLGLRYPAWDVPTQARALQVRHPLRILQQVQHVPAAILTDDETNPPLDLSLAHTRGVSPVHLEYLRNMQVEGTMSLGIVVGGKLWGMFAGHHMTAKPLAGDIRVALDIFGQMFALLLQQALEARKARGRSVGVELRRSIAADGADAAALVAKFDEFAPRLTEALGADGVALISGERTLTHGTTPPAPVLAILAPLRGGESDQMLLNIDNLGKFAPLAGCDTGASAGALVISSDDHSRLRLMFFREETVRKLTWAGNPEAQMSGAVATTRLSPRASFAAYIEERRGYAEAWSEAQLATAEELRVMLSHLVSRDDQDRRDAQSRDALGRQRQQDILIAELNHRVKNILALIKSLSRQARRSSTSLESYALALEQRIAALAAAHDLAVSNATEGVALRTILTTELEPYVRPGTGQLLLDGPAVGFRADVAPLITLVLHELVTNAAKYGALSNSAGLVRVVWSLNDAGGLDLHWSELGGPPVRAPERQGFGRSLIERAIPYELDGTAELSFDPQGVRFSFQLDAGLLVAVDENAGPAGGLDAGPAASAPEGANPRTERVAEGTRALVIEDNMVLAMDLAETLGHLGCSDVKTAGTVDVADGMIRPGCFDFALLDMNLRGNVPFPLAFKLRDLGVPFCFVTGYGSDIERPAALADVQILTKPINQTMLTQALSRMLA